MSQVAINRDYAWKKENFPDLWEDLKEALGFKRNEEAERWLKNEFFKDFLN